MNPWRTPQRVVAADCPDQIADVGRDRGPTDTTARLATPVQTEAAPMPAHQRLRLDDNCGFEHEGNSRWSQTKIRRSSVRSLSLAGADRCTTTSCWRRNAVSAPRAACDLNSPTSNPPSSFKRSSIPEARITHRGICASPDTIFGSHSRCVLERTAPRRHQARDRCDGLRRSKTP